MYGCMSRGRSDVLPQSHNGAKKRKELLSYFHSEPWRLGAIAVKSSHLIRHPPLLLQSQYNLRPYVWVLSPVAVAAAYYLAAAAFVLPYGYAFPGNLFLVYG